jgi:hypothetical protein
MAVQILAVTLLHDVPGEIYCCSTMRQVENTSVWDQDPLYAYKTQVEGGVYSIIHENDRPREATLLPSVWQMRCKRNIITGDIKRYKARLNIDGSQMVHSTCGTTNY